MSSSHFLCVYCLQIFKIIQQKSKFRVGRVCIAGSTGKKTTIKNSDIDLVLFINNELPLFEDVLVEWKNILTDNTHSYQIKDIRTTKYSIQFNAWGFEFDILPAVNFSVGNLSIELQQERVLAHIAKNPEKYRYSYSSSLADASIRFMEQQSGFVHEIVRIAKFWYVFFWFRIKPSGSCKVECRLFLSGLMSMFLFYGSPKNRHQVAENGRNLGKP